ncbi:MAG TPA: peptidylprolyl isomerase [Bacteroidales bacterium]|jgi:peptidyl-prolyl cis-trans isomerase SurA|nr:peptidylprolyl isomerase [Bacteroidales bacterium]MCZ2418013.1 peptidylprolyl isomerase [Burkholderiales bacterium]OQC58202.1 MAG: Chaperone SurA precursor [Bacteroidetes bacterium ADurb.Bin013]MBP8999679.1 peptidylprolyl isomerase [Bacteroidales bacterium]MBV6455971.1 Chaperone SurA [Bacteroidales bacterium]
MKINKIASSLLFFLSITTFAFGQKYANGLVDKVIALVGNEMIQLSAIEEEVQMQIMQGIITDKNLRCEILENMLVSKLMLNQARLDSLTVNEEYVELELENRLQEIKTRLGGEKATEDYFHKPIFKLKQEWRDLFREQSLTRDMQYAITDKIPDMTPKDIEDFYDRTSKDSMPIIPTQYQLSQIVLYPPKEEAILLVKERLLEFRERIINGERFNTLATLYSQDPYSAMRGGELGMAAKQMYWPAFGDAAIVLKEGQVSQIVETPDGFHLIQMIEREGDMFNARHILLKPDVLTADKLKCLGRLDSIATAIKSDSLTFEKAAMKYSGDPPSRLNGGRMSDENSGSMLFDKDQLKTNDYNVLKDMKEGDISFAFESRDNEGRDGNVIYKIIRLDKIVPSHVANLQDDYYIIQNMSKEKESQNAVERFIKEKQQTTYIRIDPLFRDCPFKREGWIK